ncbi:hypothetical protein [Streptococcus cristatus]|uniref:hypothetical protein n=1 Tax=Streptococcus cristatus TaxID=45634 RepID=UPI00069E5B27|nr:hypothetical protein [Streptococcus cristatus]
MKKRNAENFSESAAGCFGQLAVGIILIFTSACIVQYGWNEIVTTIVSVDKITIWQALGLDVLMTFITANSRDDNRTFKEKVISVISYQIIVLVLLLLASYFI